MYKLGTGTWYETAGTPYYNINMIGMTESEDLIDNNEESGAMAFGTAAIAAVAALMAF